jgi:hypothetical protein
VTVHATPTPIATAAESSITPKRPFLGFSGLDESGVAGVSELTRTPWSKRLLAASYPELSSARSKKVQRPRRSGRSARSQSEESPRDAHRTPPTFRSDPSARPRRRSRCRLARRHPHLLRRE